VDWKLTRGKFRPKLLDYAKQADEAAVKAVTTDGLALLMAASGGGGGRPPSEQQATAGLKKLCELKGVGPATASAMAALVQPSLPFMADEALVAAVGGRPDYSLPQYMRFAGAMQQRAEQLSQGGRGWTPVQLERCLWAEARQGKGAGGGGVVRGGRPAAAGGGGGAGAGKGRGRAAAAERGQGQRQGRRSSKRQKT
jgi:hypothetical protein